MCAALLRAKGCASARTSRRTCAAGRSGSRSTARDADLERALARVRPHAAGATQFEVLTAAALAEFAASEVDVAVVEAGLGGRHDATNVLDARVVVLTNVALEHTDVLGETREEIAAEKLAVVSPGAVVVLGEPEWEASARALGAGARRRALGLEPRPRRRGRRGVPRRARRSGRGRGAADPGPARAPQRASARDLGRRAQHRGRRLPARAACRARRFTVVASILADKNVDAMLRALSAVGDDARRDALVERPRAPRGRARRAARRRISRRVEAVDDPRAALARARELAGHDGAVLVTGSLYLLAELSAIRIETVR